MKTLIPAAETVPGDLLIRSETGDHLTVVALCALVPQRAAQQDADRLQRHLALEVRELDTLLYLRPGELLPALRLNPDEQRAYQAAEDADAWVRSQL